MRWRSRLLSQSDAIQVFLILGYSVDSGLQCSSVLELLPDILESLGSILKTAQIKLNKQNAKILFQVRSQHFCISTKLSGSAEVSCHIPMLYALEQNWNIEDTHAK